MLAAVPGCNKRFVYYLEAQGYISPRKLRKQRISRRDYSAEDVARIRRLWHYYRRGYALQAAQDLAERDERIFAYVLIPVLAARWEATLELLRGFDSVVEAGLIYGDAGDLLAKIHAADESEIYRVLDGVLEAAALGGMPRVLRGTGAGFRRPTAGEGGAMQAYVLIRVPAKQIEEVLEALRTFPAVAEAAVIYGETDIIARIEAPDQDTLDEVVMRQIHDIPAVESTRTFIVVGKMHWRR